MGNCCSIKTKNESLQTNNYSYQSHRQPVPTEQMREQMLAAAQARATANGKHK